MLSLTSLLCILNLLVIETWYFACPLSIWMELRCLAVIVCQCNSDILCCIQILSRTGLQMCSKMVRTKYRMNSRVETRVCTLSWAFPCKCSKDRKLGYSLCCQTGCAGGSSGSWKGTISGWLWKYAPDRSFDIRQRRWHFYSAYK